MQRYVLSLHIYTNPFTTDLVKALHSAILV